METNESGKTLPLPVKEIVRHMRKSLKSDRPRPRRLSNIYPIHSQRYPAVSQSARGALTPAGISTNQTFFPPSCTSVTAANSLKKLPVAEKMDLFMQCPSFSSHFPNSPLSSIYDQDRCDLGRFSGTSTYSTTSVDSVVSDDMCVLDDNMEEGSLETLLTADVINTLHQTVAFNTSAELPWSGKLESEVSLPSSSLVQNSTLTNLNTESDISFINDIMNTGESDVRLNCSIYDFCNNDVNNFTTQTGLNCVPVTSSSPDCVHTSTDNGRNFEAVSSSNGVGFSQKSPADVSGIFAQSFATLKSHFPPRAAQPQVGVAAVIKSNLEDSRMFFKQENSELGKLKSQTPNLHKLLSTKSEPNNFKSEISHSVKCHNENRHVGSGATDISTQIVPSKGEVKSIHTDFIKLEPESPKTAPRPVVKEKSTDEKWQDVKSFMTSSEKESLMRKRKRCDSGSSEHISDDDDDDESSSVGEKDQDDSDDDYSDIDADLAHLKPSECESLVTFGKKQKQFFWQYNVQSKGPKGTRLKLAVESPTDPHVLNDFEDPVFDACNTAIAGIRHGGKARKGDGNEITPNPRKLFMIGHQLMRLNHQINACQLGTDVPLARRNASRKEKNKLASRACRLKKKAQHEANKIKLYGLEQEHSQLNAVLQFIWPHIRDRARAHMREIDKLSSTSATLTSMLESQISQNLKSMIAGHTVEYVNSVILKVESGDFSGGLNIKRNQKT